MPKYLYFLEFTPKFLITYHSDLFCEISFGTSKNTKLIFSKYSDFKGLVRDWTFMNLSKEMIFNIKTPIFETQKLGENGSFVLFAIFT